MSRSAHAALPPARPQPSACVDSASVYTVPRRPKAGALFELRARGNDASLRAMIAGALLVLRRQHGDSIHMLGAIPIDSTRDVTLRIECARSDRGDARAVEIRVPVDSGRYRLERLRVAPRYSAPADSALSARMALEASRAGEVSRQSLLTPQLWSGPFIAPRPSRVTSGFGSGRVFNQEVVSRHMGTDFAGAVGAPVRATNRGVVRLADRFFLGGNVLYVDHGAGVITAYLHLSRTLVAVGDTVERGAVIGHVGATGRVTGPHLHLIARLGAVTVDPGSLIGRR